MLDEQIGSGTTNLADIHSAYDPHTLQLTSQLVQRHATTLANVDQETYNHDLAGNVTSQVSERLGSSTDTETQCFQYNGIDQLTQAWTGKSGCTTAPTSSNVTTTAGDGISAASAYWTTWSYDTTAGNTTSDILGEMTSQVQHALTTGGTSTTTANTFGGSTGGPHALTTSAVTGGATANSTFAYDAAGNMTTRKVAATGTQTLKWNAAGQLTSITGGTAGTTSYVYAPDGSLLLQEDQGTTSVPAATTVYLDGEQLTATTASGKTTVTGARIIPLPSGGDVVRTGAGTSYYFEIPDPHGTNDLYLDSTAQVPTWRQYTPYGAPRGTTTTWIDNRGFLNKPNDPDTGLTYVGARGYDPVTGQFTSPDPILKVSDPVDLNPYAYAYGNPIGNSDPSGLGVTTGDSDDGGCNGSACYDGGATTTSDGGSASQQTGGSGGGETGGSGGSSGSPGGFGPWAPPKPKPVLTRVLTSPAGCVRLSDCTYALEPVDSAQNSDTDWDLLFDYLTGLGPRYQHFDGSDPMTLDLMGDPNNTTLRKNLPILLRTHSSGISNYHDSTSVGAYVLDGLGAMTHGLIGHNYADSFTGSYEESWQAVYQSSHMAMVYFTVINYTNLNSAVHPEVLTRVPAFKYDPYNGDPYVGVAPAITSIHDWSEGPLAQMTQVFQWQEPVGF